MAQQMTIPIAPRRQEQIDRYCALAGVNREKALEEVWDLWEKQVYIPLSVKLEVRKNDNNTLAWFDDMRAKAERGETPDLSMEEIIEEIRLARTERRAKEQVQ